MSTVLVTDASRGSAVAFIRSLARAGHTVVAGDDRRVSAGRWSRSASASFRYPDPYTDAAGAAAAIHAQVVRHGVEVVLPITDAAIRAVESVADRLPAGCRIGTAPADAAAIAADKQRTVELAQRVGVPVPETIVVHAPADAADAGDRLGWPVVVKPVSSLTPTADGAVHKAEVGYGHDRDHLVQQVELLGGGAPVLLQEYCAGTGVGVEVLAHRGRVLRSFAHERIHEVPVTGGASALRRSIPVDPELLEHTARLVSGLDWTGLAMVEFKRGARGHRLMEINGRPWGSLPLAVRAGVDFPADYVRLLLGGDPDRIAAGETDGYACGVVARNLQLEVVWIASVLRGPHGALPPGGWPSRRSAATAIARLLSPRVDDDVLSWRDPLPGVAEIVSAGARLARKVPFPTTRRRG